MRPLALLPLVAACGHFEFAAAVDAGTQANDDGGRDADTEPADAPDDTKVELGNGLLVHFEFEDVLSSRESVSGEIGTCTNGGCPGITPADPTGLALPVASFSGNTCIGFPAESIRPQQFTFAAWIRFEENQSSTVFTRTLDASTNSRAFALFLTTTPEHGMRVGNHELKLFTSANTWHHVAGVYTPAYARMYIDGESTAMIGSPIPLTYPDDTFDFLWIGCHAAGDTDISAPFTGRLADVRLYDRPLNAAEISALVELGQQ